MKRPCVSIGLPVYNGERFLGEALDSILAQTFTDFELIVSDNASTDRTEQICRDYAARDRRIQYCRNDRNVGAAPNFNRTFALSSGEYFKWAAHDDMLAPDCLRQCVKTLDRAPPSVVLCLPRTTVVDADGNTRRHLGFIGEPPTDQGAGSARAFRFSHVVRFSGGDVAQVAFSLVRADALRQTRLMGAYHGADYVFAVEMSLLGELRQIPQRLFLLRMHGQNWERLARSWSDEARWWDGSRSRVVTPPVCRVLLETLRAVNRADLPGTAKLRCALRVRGWIASRLRRKLRRSGWAAWSWMSVQAASASRHTSIPLRIWALVRLLRREHRWRFDRALRDAWLLTDADLASDTARALAARRDAASRRILDQWLTDPNESRRLAVASALGEQTSSVSRLDASPASSSVERQSDAHRVSPTAECAASATSLGPRT